MKAWLAEELDLRRWHLVIIALIVGLVAGFAVWGYGTLHDIQREQQVNRQAAIRDLCMRTNEIAHSQQRFIAEVNAKLLPLALKRFRIVDDCSAYAERIVRPSR